MFSVNIGKYFICLLILKIHGMHTMKQVLHFKLYKIYCTLKICIALSIWQSCISSYSKVLYRELRSS